MNKIITLCAALMACQPVAAQTVMKRSVFCGDTQTIFTRLSEQFDEVSQFRGVTASSQLDSLWVNTETGSYTFTQTRGDVTCMLSAGTNGEFARRPARPNI